jgi:hypothetical protein
MGMFVTDYIILIETNHCALHSQESGRAGRDGAHAYCYIVPSKRRPLADKEKDPQDHKGQKAMMDVVYEGDQCLRYESTLFLDGKGRKCSDNAQAIPCSRCKAKLALTGQRGQVNSILGKRTRDSHHLMDQLDSTKKVKKYMDDTFGQATEHSKRRRVERLEMKDDYVVKFRAALSKFDGMCAFCMVWGEEVPFHSILRCTTLLGHQDLTTTAETYRLWKGNLSYDFKKHGKVCFFCHIPQCDDALHDTFQSGAQGCEHPDLLGGLAYGIFHHKKWCGKAEKHFGGTWNSEVCFIKWLNAIPIKGHKTNMTALFLWFSNQI